MNWTQEREQLLRKRVGEGCSAGLIAKELGGVTRNAVLGKAHRLGLKLKGGIGGADNPQASLRRRAPPVKHAALPGTVKHLRGDRAPDVPLPALRLVAAANPVDLFSRKSGMCAYPVSGSGADTLYCGGETTGVYCTSCRALMTKLSASPSRRKAAARDFLRHAAR